MKKLIIIATLFLSGCAALVPNEEKTYWDIDGDSTYGDEWWIQGMEMDMEIAIRKINIEFPD